MVAASLQLSGWLPPVAVVGGAGAFGGDHAGTDRVFRGAAPAEQGAALRLQAAYAGL